MVQSVKQSDVYEVGDFPCDPLCPPWLSRYFTKG